jgi:hypothetical protein
VDYRATYSGGTLRLKTNRMPDLSDGEQVVVTIERQRSEASHRQQFAWIKDAWSNLPEHLAFEPWAATPETLRKHALCQTGFFEQAVVDCGDAKVAREVAKQILEARRKSDGYAHGIIRQGVAIVRWPQSQSYRAMGADRFRESKTAILEWIAAQIGVQPEDLTRAAA